MFPISAFTYETFASVRLEVMDIGNRRLGVGTGFVAKFGGHHYIVTARHVLLGASSRDEIDQNTQRSYFINTNCFIMSVENGRSLIENRSILIDLYKCDGSRNWNEAFDWDIAAINITPQVEGVSLAPIAINLSDVVIQMDDNDRPISVTADEDLPEVGSDVFIVGYPGNLSYLTNDRSPLWKRASISSAPHMNLNDSPIFLVDTQGASGLSGSPVLFNGPRLVSPLGGKRLCDYTDSRFRLVGIYCGREGYAPDAISLSMGRVFKRSAIQHTIMEPPADDERQVG